MPTNSSSQSPPSRPPIVVVQANDTRLQFTPPPGRDFRAFHKQDSEMLTNEGLVAISTNTTMTFNFNGTGIAVVGLTQNPFPPVPTKLLPSFSCMVDEQHIDRPVSHHHKSQMQSNASSEIPADGKQVVCRTKDLTFQNHTLTVSITVSTIPAFIDSVRFRPFLANNGSERFNFNNTILRVDSYDTSRIWFNQTSWGYEHDNVLVSGHHRSHSGLSSGGFMNVTIPNAGVRKLEWYGNVEYVGHDHDEHQPLQVFLNGNPMKVPLDPSKDWPFGGGSRPTFSLPVEGPSHSKVELSIPAPHEYKLSLDHLMVTVGAPMIRKFEASYSPTNGTAGKMDAHHKINPAVPIVSGIVGSLVVILVTLFIVRWFEKRRRWRYTWKDSALPSAIQHPATRVLSRSSFSREVVTGDIEYNPEAQKKLESAFDARIMEPPQALVVHHADSGYRVIGVSEVPPHYTRA